MTARLTSQPSLGRETAGVRFTDSRRVNSELVRIHRVSGWENAPIEPMDEVRHPGYWTRRVEYALAGLVVLAVTIMAVSL